MDAYTNALFEGQRAALEILLPDDVTRHTSIRRRITRAVEAKVRAVTLALATSVVAEVGAHEASFARAIKAASPATRVLAMEANPSVYEKNRAEAVSVGVEYQQICVSNHIGERTFTVPLLADGRHRTTMGSLLSDTRAAGEFSYNVASQTLDQLVGDTSNVLWIDVEGGIGEVLESGATTLRQTQALYVEVERIERWGGQWTDTAVIRHLARFDLVPVLRDIQRPWQYNVLFLRRQRLMDPNVLVACGL